MIRSIGFVVNAAPYVYFLDSGLTKVLSNVTTSRVPWYTHATGVRILNV